MKRLRAVVVLALLLVLASAGTAGWSLYEQMNLQSRVDALTAQVSSATADAAGARLAATESQGAVVTLDQSLRAEISTLSADLEEVRPNRLSNRPSLEDVAGDVAGVTSDLATTKRDMDDLRFAVDSLASKYRGLCTTLQLHSDLFLRC
jgi:hypothetical protein